MIHGWYDSEAWYPFVHSKLAGKKRQTNIKHGPSNVGYILILTYALTALKLNRLNAAVLAVGGLEHSLDPWQCSACSLVSSSVDSWFIG